jgi:lambda family phage portal protein
MNILDRAASKISPEWAVRRQIARQVSDELGRISSSDALKPQRSETRWRGASNSLRSLSSWITTLGSGRTDLPEHERLKLISRSQDAYRNHMLARAAVTRVRTNVIGTGIIPHADVDHDVLGISEDEASELNVAIDNSWSHYAENPLECDAEATLDHYAQQDLVEVSSLIAGDVFALTPFNQRPGCTYGLKVQLIDAARVSNPPTVPPRADFVDGVEFDSTGAPKRYWIRDIHPDERYSATDGWHGFEVFGPATGRRRALHVFSEKDRISQVRGAPYLAPILEPLQTLEQYSRAELVAALVSAMFTVFIKKPKETYNAAGNPLAALGGTAESTTAGQAPTITMGPGAVVDGAPGEEFEFANPSRPNANFDPFFVAVCTQMGAALELPVDELLLRYQASYSAARAAMLQAWRFYTRRRASRVSLFCQPVRGLWFDEAAARGIIATSGYSDPARRAAYTRCIWIGPARGSMDEEKEARGARARIDAGVSNETIETAAMTGENWSTVYARRRREIEQRRKDGNFFPPSQGTGAAQQQPERGAPNE